MLLVIEIKFNAKACRTTAPICKISPHKNNGCRVMVKANLRVNNSFASR